MRFKWDQVYQKCKGQCLECSKPYNIYFAIFIRIMTYTQKTLNAASDNQSISFHTEGKGQHQNNNKITWDLIL